MITTKLYIYFKSCFLGWTIWNYRYSKVYNISNRASLVAQTVKNLPVMQATWVGSLGWEDPREKEMAAHSSILAWEIPWTEEPGGLLFMGSQRVGHDWVTKHCTKAKVKWVCENVLFFLIEFCGWAFIVLWHSLGIWIWLLCENFLIRWEVWVTRCWNFLP